nr:MAG: DNA pilot protein [Microviridae sp.]
MKEYVKLQRDFGQILENTVGSALGGGVGGAISEGLGLLFGQTNNTMQQNNQQALINQQMQANEQLSQFNTNQNYQLWQETNYPAQVQQLEKAGLNPALLYAKGGPGGSTGASTSGVGMGIAPGTTPNQVAQTAQESQALGIQQSMQEAQIEVLKSQANLNNTEAQNKGKGGVVNENIQANTELTQQQVDNARQAFDNQQLQNTMQNILNYEQQSSQKDRLTYIAEQAKQAVNQTSLIANEKKIATATTQDQIKIIQQTAIGSVLKNAATQANISLTEQQIKESINTIMQNWDNQGLNSNANERATLQQILGIKTEGAQETYDNIIKAIGAIKGTSISPLNVKSESEATHIRY